jgi:SAM-dependent methyltransferase
MTSKPSFWEEPEQVARFAAREPDERLQRLVTHLSGSFLRALDIGCAGGRNTVFLVERGFDVWAIDSSRSMVEKTRSRLAALTGEEQARRRVREGVMDRLEWDSESFDLVVALGVYHCAQSRTEWERALGETARVVKSGGHCLVSVFTPETDLTGEGIRRVHPQDPLFEGFPGGRFAYLVDGAALDAEMALRGLFPLWPTETVWRGMETGRRVSANGLYVKRLLSSPTVDRIS